MNETKFKLTTKKQRDLFKTLEIGTRDELVMNPYSKVQIVLCPEAYALYDLIKTSERDLRFLADIINLKLAQKIKISKEIDKKWNKTESTFYTARDIFMKIWISEYMALLD